MWIYGIKIENSNKIFISRGQLSSTYLTFVINIKMEQNLIQNYLTTGLIIEIFFFQHYAL